MDSFAQYYNICMINMISIITFLCSMVHHYYWYVATPQRNGEGVMFFCFHPFAWRVTSSSLQLWPHCCISLHIIATTCQLVESHEAVGRIGFQHHPGASCAGAWDARKTSLHSASGVQKVNLWTVRVQRLLVIELTASAVLHNNSCVLIRGTIKSKRGIW